MPCERAWQVVVALDPCANTPPTNFESLLATWTAISVVHDHHSQHWQCDLPMSYPNRPFARTGFPTRQRRRNTCRPKDSRVRTVIPREPCIVDCQCHHSLRTGPLHSFVDCPIPWPIQNQRVSTHLWNRIQYYPAVVILWLCVNASVSVSVNGVKFI